MFSSRSEVYTVLKQHPQPLNSSVNIFIRTAEASEAPPPTPHTHTHTHINPTSTPPSRLPSWGDRQLNGFIGTVQCLSSVKWESQWDGLGFKAFSLSLFFSPLNFWVYSAGVGGCGSGGGWWRGVLLPPLLFRVTQTSPSSPSPPTLLSVPVR